MLTFYIRFLGYLNIDIKDDVDWDPFQLMEEEFMVEKTYMVLRKNSVLKDSLDIMIGRCFDTGLTLKWEEEVNNFTHLKTNATVLI